MAKTIVSARNIALLFAASTVVVAAPLPAQSDAVGAPSGAVARWVSPPKAMDLNRYVPRRVIDERISGVAYLACRVGLDQRASDCRMLKELPAGSGFGEAALKASPTFRIKAVSANGQAVDQAWVVVPIRYNFRKAPAASEWQPNYIYEAPPVQK